MTDENSIIFIRYAAHCFTFSFILAARPNGSQWDAMAMAGVFFSFFIEKKKRLWNANEWNER